MSSIPRRAAVGAAAQCGDPLVLRLRRALRTLLSSYQVEDSKDYGPKLVEKNIQSS